MHFLIINSQNNKEQLENKRCVFNLDCHIWLLGFDLHGFCFANSFGLYGIVGTRDIPGWLCFISTYT